MKISKENRDEEKSIKRLIQRVETSRFKGEELRNIEGTTFMDSGTTSTSTQPKDNMYVIEINEPFNKIFTVATGDQARAGNQAKLQVNL